MWSMLSSICKTFLLCGLAVVAVIVGNVLLWLQGRLVMGTILILCGVALFVIQAWRWLHD